MPTECHVGGILLYISKNMDYKPRKDLNICKSHELKSIFIEIVIDVVYRHPTMDLNEFNDKYVNKLLDNVSKENKGIFYKDSY